MTEKIPMVIPSTVSTVRSRFTRMAEMANKKLSFMSLRNNMTQIYELLHNAQRTMHNAKGSKHNAQCTKHNAYYIVITTQYWFISRSFLS